MELNQVEVDFIEFVSLERNKTIEEITDIFIKTRNKFEFSSQSYREICNEYHNLCKILYDDSDEKSLIDTYVYHELLHTFRYISYSYPKPSPDIGAYIRSLSRSLAAGDYNKILNFIKRKLMGDEINEENAATKADYTFIAKLLTDLLGKDPVVVDYGCGLGYHALEVWKINKNSKIFLVDIDCLHLRFTEFRFKKLGINVETIKVNKDNLYPLLPSHNICIATEVMEHVSQPLTVYKNINTSLNKGGILYGSFEDHNREMLHVSTNLETLRKERDKSYETVSHLCYRKL